MNGLDKQNISNLVRGIGLATNMSVSIGVTAFLGVLAGNYLDERIGGGKGIIFSIVMLLSIVMGFYGAIRALLKAIDTPAGKGGSGKPG